MQVNKPKVFTVWPFTKQVFQSLKQITELTSGDYKINVNNILKILMKKKDKMSKFYQKVEIYFKEDSLYLDFEKVLPALGLCAFLPM